MARIKKNYSMILLCLYSRGARLWKPPESPDRESIVKYSFVMWTWSRIQLEMWWIVRNVMLRHCGAVLLPRSPPSPHHRSGKVAGTFPKYSRWWCRWLSPAGSREGVHFRHNDETKVFHMLGESWYFKLVPRLQYYCYNIVIQQGDSGEMYYS